MLSIIHDDVTTYLDNIKNIINKNNNNLIISTNRDKNLNFMIKYGLKINSIIEIINSLDNSNFIEKVENEHIKFSNEILYVFSKNLDLVDVNGKNKNVTIYIKFNLLNDKVILISFHEAKYKIKGK